MELKAAFAELQSKVVENKQKMKLHDIQIESLKRNITHSTLTDTEIAQLPKDTKVIYFHPNSTPLLPCQYAKLCAFIISN